MVDKLPVYIFQVVMKGQNYFSVLIKRSIFKENYKIFHF